MYLCFQSSIVSRLVVVQRAHALSLPRARLAGCLAENGGCGMPGQPDDERRSAFRNDGSPGVPRSRRMVVDTCDAGSHTASPSSYRPRTSGQTPPIRLITAICVGGSSRPNRARPPGRVSGGDDYASDGFRVGSAMIGAPRQSRITPAQRSDSAGSRSDEVRSRWQTRTKVMDMPEIGPVPVRRATDPRRERKPRIHIAVKALFEALRDHRPKWLHRLRLLDKGNSVAFR